MLDTYSQPETSNAAIVLENGTVFWGRGFGKEGIAEGEICFNTAMTGYEEIMTDASYAGQIVTFTFPHIGNVGTNREDLEAKSIAARGMITREFPTTPSNWRSEHTLDDWLKSENCFGISGVDTRALTHIIRDLGAPNAVIAYSESAPIDVAKLLEIARKTPSLEGLDLAKEVTCDAPYHWTSARWAYGLGYSEVTENTANIVAIDYGAKNNILRCLVSAGANVTVVPAKTSAKEILTMNPDGVFLSNGPGDPKATGEYAVPMIQEILAADLPIFGICLGHQMLALALGAKTVKMNHGHHGANHPVKDLETGKVEITSMNHGFAVDASTLPESAMETHVSLFDGSNCGIRMKDKPVFSVQQHPEASPGPTDSYYLFERFLKNVREHKK